jgi:hypothetical protein
LVERNLAKVEVASSSLVSRSIIPRFFAILGSALTGKSGLHLVGPAAGGSLEQPAGRCELHQGACLRRLLLARPGIGGP